ncbi:magnesium transporter CorA family protein [Aerophototrophica crusticola]|uniref:Magnesium transport protein CorA n=1 Tax=Aerophototrophica crusticola TaxID=1709002 RepID=A0A858R8B7_9PROT|nr:magnesium transporter CorA family protein [Rhodospirillaceae bacterium B3]
MIRAYRVAEGRNERLPDDAGSDLLRAAAWIDLLSPSPEEQRLVERTFRIELPTREEMREIELSSRIYREEAGVFMTATVLCRADAPVPETMDITFVLAAETLITLRFDDPKPFYGFHNQAARNGIKLDHGVGAFTQLLDAILDRVADVLEGAGRDVNQVAQHLLIEGHGGALGSDMQHQLLKRIARAHDLTAKARESLVTLTRVLAFLATVREVAGDKAMRARLKTLTQDTQSLADYTAFLSSNIAFQLDALLGVVGIEQNNIVKIFSVAAVVFLPPTLVASIYGMNFHHMPELDWEWGYPMALALMVLSVLVPLVWFKRRGWL